MTGIPFKAGLVERGDRMLPAQIVHCSEKGCTHELPIFNSKQSRLIPPTMLKRKIQQHDWTVVGHQPYCKEHSKHKVEKLPKKPQPPKPKPAPHRTALRSVLQDLAPAALAELIETVEPAQKELPMVQSTTPIRSLEQLGDATARAMTLEHRRRINREIGDNWDDTKSHYLGDASDQKIASGLNVPRQWVEQVRVENYGESGGNEEIDNLKLVLDNQITQWSAQLADAQRAVENAMNKLGGMERMVADLKALRQRLERVETAVLPRSR